MIIEIHELHSFRTYLSLILIGFNYIIICTIYLYNASYYARYSKF